MSVDLKNVACLSERQREILRLVAKNLQVKEVAHILSISPNTVKTHTEVARRRLGAQSTREAARAVIDYESSANILHHGGDSKRLIAETAGLAPSFAHEQALHPTANTLPDDPMERSGDSLKSAGHTFKGTYGRGSFSRPEGKEFGPLNVQDNLFPHSRNGLVDYGLGQFIRRLKSLNSVQWSGLVIAIFAVCGLLFIGLLSIGLNLVEAIKLIHHQIGA